MITQLGVGLIGANAERGWARAAHVPAIQSLPGLELVAVATRRPESAKAAAAFDAPAAYVDPLDLIRSDDVDVVAVASTVSSHHELIIAALRAGKHVITEWPVASTVAETAEIADLADATGCHVAVGLQGRKSPATVEALRRISRGDIGGILYATVHSAVAAFGSVVDQSALYLEDLATGMNLPTIMGGHTLDLATHLAGYVTSCSAMTSIQYPTVSVAGSTTTRQRTIADHILVQGRLAGGGVLAADVVGGRPVDDAVFRLDVVGRDGVITLSGGGPSGFQAGTLVLTVNGERVDVEHGELASLPAVAVNTAGVYAALRDDVRDDTHTAPGPRDAVRLQRLVEVIQKTNPEVVHD
ncbi:Gfo/Idh/MocA family oxidoreductase [Mycobacterium yunnanensis]|uniref:Gfo/Idh/MocA family oxidoreductase n=1 Tax=Mycobacterium yunnanensis TaxID=368477 RepID=A0A9X3C4H3_9MYCO|nr:Gfo/Idh/MocA family oxidoreductase [Mycobacterium yunnanensis]MCV7424461.1 Gfo/Idh/MocA family oxidoreductase [Mycobacterium yunnanensis]